ncbi:hypothetical protein HG531_013724 [Fusarium graminearum]|nr:hypothetical protein HG531_013724 [Fusarium graminearum]
MRFAGKNGFTIAGLPRPMRSQAPSLRAASMPARVRNPPVTIKGVLGSLARISRANSRKKDSRAAVLADFFSPVPVNIYITLISKFVGVAARMALQTSTMIFALAAGDPPYWSVLLLVFSDKN